MRIKVIPILLLSVFFLSCEGPKEIDVKISPDESNFTMLTTHEYSFEELTEITQADKNISALGAEYPIECARHVGDVYRIAYRGENHVAILYFDEGGKKTFGRVYAYSAEKEAFSDIIGFSVEQVVAIDPQGSYAFLYTGRNDYRESQHYTRDGFVLRVKYSADGVVEEVHTGLI